MKIRSIAFAVISSVALSANAKVPQTFEEAAQTLSKPDYDNFVFCATTAGASWGIMDKLNAGQSAEYLYEDVSRIKDARTREAVNKIVTIANQLKTHSNGMASPDEFLDWNFNRCIDALLPGIKDK